MIHEITLSNGFILKIREGIRNTVKITDDNDKLLLRLAINGVFVSYPTREEIEKVLGGLPGAVLPYEKVLIALNDFNVSFTYTSFETWRWEELDASQKPKLHKGSIVGGSGFRTHELAARHALKTLQETYTPEPENTEQGKSGLYFVCFREKRNKHSTTAVKKSVTVSAHNLEEAMDIVIEQGTELGYIRQITGVTLREDSLWKD